MTSRRLTDGLFLVKLFRKLTLPPDQPTSFPKPGPLPSFRFETRIAIVLIMFGAALMATNHWFTMVDDEIAIIDVAAKPMLHTVGAFLGGTGQHEHPPLSDLILHGWLRLTNGNAHLLRLPSIFFYILGVWFLVLAARRIAGERAGYCALILVLLWPYGFHFGRIAGWYSFTFMLVSLVTLVYLRYLEHPSLTSWLPVVLTALAMVYSNYFGWALLACLGLDLVCRFPRDVGKWMLLLATGAILLAASLPVIPAFIAELHKGGKPTLSISAIPVGIYNLYCLFVSESVAPWFWAAGITAGLAIACALLLVAIYATPSARRWLFYFAVLLMGMTVLQIGNTKRVLMISPWLILAIGTSLAVTTSQTARRILLASLAIIAAIGWFGIFSRKYYAGPRWIEPWDQTASHAATAIDHGGIVIGNNPSFFFYLTYDLPETNPATNPTTKGHFVGFLPISVRFPSVYSPQQWAVAGRPTSRNMLLVDGLSFQVTGPSMDEIRAWINSRCRITDEEHLVHDPGADWKREYQPQTGQRAWRIQEDQYDCSTSAAPGTK